MLENRLPSLLQQYKARFPIASNSVARDAIINLNKLDPTGKKGTYTSWILKQRLNGRMKEKFIYNTLLNLETMKKKNILQKGFDFNKQNVDSLSSFLASLNGIESKKDVIRRNYIKAISFGKLLYEDETYSVLRIRKSDDIIKFLKLRKITSWCINDREYAIEYAPVYFILKNKKVIAVWSEKDKLLSNRKNNYDTWYEKLIDNFVKILKKANPKLSISIISKVFPAIFSSTTFAEFTSA